MSRIWYQGKLQPAEEIKIFHDDRSFLYGDGIFETLRTFQGRPFQFREHAERMLASARALGFSFSVSVAEMVAILTETAMANMAEGVKDLYLRATLSRGSGYSPDITRDYQSELLVYAKPLPEPDPEIYTRGITAILATELRPAGGRIFQHKSTSYFSSLLARQEAAKAGAGEAIISDTDGNVLEGACSNLFLVKDNRLYTAPLEANLLPGITRATLLSLAKKKGIVTEETKFTFQELREGEEVILTNSIMGIMPVVGIAGEPIGQGKPGEICRTLSAAYAELT